MDGLHWDIEKNKRLQRERDLSFEQVEYALANNQLLDILEHPNQAKCPGQFLLIVKINGYAAVVPAQVHNDGLILKTIFYDRKMNKKYLGDAV